MGRAFARLLLAVVSFWLFAVLSPVYAYNYGVGLYGSGAYNVGQQIPTTISVGSSVNPAIEGAGVRITATISPSTATGTITFKDAGITIGTSTLRAGSGSLTLTTLRQGTHFITAVYAGNSNFATSTSAALTQTIQLASTDAGNTSGSTGGGGSRGGGASQTRSTPAVAPTSAPTTPPRRVLTASQSRRLKALQRRARALQRTIDRTSNTRVKKRLQTVMKIINRAIERLSK